MHHNTRPAHFAAPWTPGCGCDSTPRSPPLRLADFGRSNASDAGDGVPTQQRVRTRVRARLPHTFLANTMPGVVMYISCFVGRGRASSLGSHQTFMQPRRIYISRERAQPNLLGRAPPRPSRYRFLLYVSCLLLASRRTPPFPPNASL